MQDQLLYVVRFDGNDIGGFEYVTLYNHNFNNYPKRDVKIHKLARTSLSAVTSADLVSKDITVWLEICASGRTDTELAISNVKSILTAESGLLEVINAGYILEYLATLNEFNIEWDGITAICELQFIASTPTGSSAKSYDLFNIIGNTSSTANQTAVVLGSYQAEPVTTVVFSAVNNAGGLGSFSVYNAKTNQGIDITVPAIAPNDIIVIDSYKKSVTANGIEIDFKGTFPVFDPNTQSLGYSDTYTSRNVNINVVYNINVV